MIYIPVKLRDFLTFQSSITITVGWITSRADGYWWGDLEVLAPWDLQWLQVVVKDNESLTGTKRNITPLVWVNSLTISLLPLPSPPLLRTPPFHLGTRGWWHSNPPPYEKINGGFPLESIWRNVCCLGNYFWRLYSPRECKAFVIQTQGGPATNRADKCSFHALLNWMGGEGW